MQAYEVSKKNQNRDNCANTAIYAASNGKLNPKRLN